MTHAFRVDVPGQPPSWNASYRIITIRKHGSLKKMPPAATYQATVTDRTRIARPADFNPSGQVFICYQMFLKRNMDADNILKIANDAISVALDINDSRFLPVVLSKSSGNAEPRLVISILDAEFYKLEVLRAGDRGVE